MNFIVGDEGGNFGHNPQSTRRCNNNNERTRITTQNGILIGHRWGLNGDDDEYENGESITIITEIWRRASARSLNAHTQCAIFISFAFILLFVRRLLFRFSLCGVCLARAWIAHVQYSRETTIHSINFQPDGWWVCVYTRDGARRHSRRHRRRARARIYFRRVFTLQYAFSWISFSRVNICRIV